jgi:porin
MLYPKSGEHVTAITGLTFTQALSSDWQLAFGKFNALDMFYQLYPQTGRGVETFMQTSIALPLAVARLVPLSFMGAGIIKLQDGKPQAGLLVYDTHNVPTTSGFDELFDNGVNFMAYYRIFTKYRGLPGSHYFGGLAGTGDFFAADPTGFVFVPGQGLVASPSQDGSWAAIYILEQTMWADSCRPTRNVQFLSGWSIADERTCPVGWTGNATLQFNGMNCARPHDSFGIGYFYTGLSDDFRTLLAPIISLGDVHGGELYYRVALTKCCQVTADLQVIEPAENANDTAVVVGLRAMLGF